MKTGQLGSRTAGGLPVLMVAALRPGFGGLRQVDLFADASLSKLNAEFSFVMATSSECDGNHQGDAAPFFTIGHSTRMIAEFVELLQESRISLVVDVRSMPQSRTNPQFNGEALPEALGPWQIGYDQILER